MALLDVLVPIFAPVIICAGTGYLWNRLAFPFDQKFVTALVMNVAGPCLIIGSLTRLEASTVQFASVLLAGVLMLVGCSLIGAVGLRLASLPVRNYVPLITFGNSGNLALPVCYFAFGEQGLGLALGVFVINTLGQVTLQPLLAARTALLRTLATTPLIYAVVLGFIMFVSRVKPPQWAANTLQLLGNLTIPLMLLSLGYSLGQFAVKRFGFALGLAMLRLFAGATVGVAVVTLLQMEGLIRGVVLTQSLMPAAVISYLFAARYDRDPENVAGVIVLSTLLAAMVLPVFMYFYLPVR
jgi:predicted permease